MVHGIFGHCEFSESGQIPHTDLEQQTKMPSLRAKRGHPSQRTSTMDGRAALAMTGGGLSWSAE